MTPQRDFSEIPIKYELWWLLLLTLLAFFIYADTLTGPYIFDDKPNILQNPHIRLTRLHPGDLLKAGFESPSSHRPVANISFALNYYFNRYNVVGYHLVNILIHILNGILFYFLAQNTLRTPALRPGVDRFARNWAPLLAAFIWTLHPLQTQSVSYIVQRMNSLATLFYLMSLLLYVKCRLSQSKRQRRWLAAGCGAAGLLACGSKEVAVTLPLFMILYEWYFFQNLSGAWLKQKLPLIAGAAVLMIALALLFLGQDPLSRIAAGYIDRDLSMGQRVLTQFRVVVFYLSLIIWPHPSRLNLDHDFGLSYSLTDPLSTLLCLAAIVSCLVLAVCLAKKARLVSFGILWFFGNLVIESSVIALEIIFEHRAYLPSTMVILMLVVLVFRYLKPRQICVPILCALIALATLWTYQRNRVWQDAITLWQDCVAKSPNKARPYNNLGVALAMENRLQEATDNYYKALQINPEYGNAHYNLGFVLARAGNFKDGIAHLTEALRLEPDNFEAHNNLGIALLMEGRLQEAVAHFQKAVEINADYAPAHNNLGIALGRRGNLAKAVLHFKVALDLDPTYAEAHNNLGSALSRQGKFKEAAGHFAEALRINPGYAAARQNYEENQKNLK